MVAKNSIHCDLLVVGAGLAGSVAAWEAARSGLKIILIEVSDDNASSWAQGGVVLPESFDLESLKNDILKAGNQLNYTPAVDVLVTEGNDAIESFLVKQMGVEFDCDPKTGTWHRALEAAHSRARIVHASDQSGRAIMSVLREKISRENNIQVLKACLVDLLMTHRHDRRFERRFCDAECAGAYVYVLDVKDVVAIKAKTTILATGGYSSLYEHSTGPRFSRGDGVAAAHHAGARTLHMDWMQFHPTTLYVAGESRYLLTEALRGAGAKIHNHEGKEFVDSLAPRNFVAEAMTHEMTRSRSECVFLDLTQVDSLPEKFPYIFSLLKKFRFDSQLDRVPIVPAAHYSLGGVWADLWGKTSLNRLYAVGEVACNGLHGNNRLASTSLLEAVVFARRVVQGIVASNVLDQFLDFEVRSWKSSREEADLALIDQDASLLRKTLWNYLGLIKTPERAQRAERILSELRKSVESFYRRCEISEQLLGVRHGVLVAVLILYATRRSLLSNNPHLKLT